jgi:hypothetical protein
MVESSPVPVCEPRYELRFTGLHNRGRGYAFPCDAAGHVRTDQLTDQARGSYLRAQAAVGSELSAPVVVCCSA